MQLKDITDEGEGIEPTAAGNHRNGGGKAPNRWAIFVIFFKKFADSTPFRSIFSHFQSQFKELHCKDFQAS